MIAIASGARATCAAKSSGIDVNAGSGRINTARLPHLSNRSCSPASSRSIDDSLVAGSTVMAAST
ncbi:Uncharacterised protein [Mycobacteroides abscessus subsp. abscessus]|nr:Uncharacterised protein [Mycobacteroides abscessus subsp. abscessus]